MVPFEIPEDVVLSVHTFIMGCGWTISSNAFRRIMTSLPVTKNPPVSASASEAATNFKILLFTCGAIQTLNLTGRLHASGLVRYDASVSACKIMSEA